MARRTWRDDVAPIVAEAIEDAESRGLTGKDLETAVRRRKPYWCAHGWLYKVWLTEVRFQLGLKSRRAKPAEPADLPGQMRLF